MRTYHWANRIDSLTRWTGGFDCRDGVVGPEFGQVRGGGVVPADHGDPVVLTGPDDVEDADLLGVIVDVETDDAVA
jgi:hypothetical protein